MHEHGFQWGTMVDSVNAFLASNGMAARSAAWSAIDAEPDWATFSETEPWTLGFAATPNNTPFVNFGSADGCPDEPGGGSCNREWSQHDVWAVANSSLLGWPFPEIYNEMGTNARQWQQIKLAVQPAWMLTIGTLTQWQACEPTQPGGPTPLGCDGARNLPEVGWQQLQALMNGDPSTADPVYWATDIGNSQCPGGAPEC